MEGGSAVIKSVVETITTGCRNTVGGDCHWRREYLLLKKRHDEYRSKVEFEIKKMSNSEFKMGGMKNEMEILQKNLIVERESLRVKTISLETDKAEAFRQGAEQARAEARDHIKYYAELRATAEAEYMGIQGKVLVLEKEKEDLEINSAKRVTALERRIKELESFNLALSGDLEVIREDARVTVAKYKEVKEKAVSDYVDLHQKFTELKIENQDNLMDLNVALDCNDRFDSKYEKLLEEKEILEFKNAEQKLQYDADINALKSAIVVRDLADKQQYREEIEIMNKEFRELCVELDNRKMIIAEVVNNDRYKSKMLADNAHELKRTFNTVLMETFQTLVKLEQERNEAFAERKVIQQELEVVGGSMQNLNRDVSNCTRETILVIQELLDTFGIPHSAVVPDKDAHRSNSFENHISISKVAMMEDLKSQMNKLKGMTETLKKWTVGLMESKARLLDRKCALESELQKEKINRIRENEIYTKKAKIYKTLILKLKGRLEVKRCQFDTIRVPKSKLLDLHHEMDENATGKSLAAESVEEFRLMLDRAEQALQKVDDSQIVSFNAESVPAASLSRSCSLPTF